MYDLNAIIAALDNEQKQKLQLFLVSRNKRSNTKNVHLVKLLSQGESNSKTLCEELYGKDNRTAYHALRKRLFDSIIDFTANISLSEENSIDMKAIKYILAARSFLLQKQFKIAYSILDKAEALASEHLLFAILNEIYHTKIQYAYAYSGVNIDDIIKKQRENWRQHQLEDQLNMVYAKIRKVLIDISYKREVVDFEEVLNRISETHNIELNESLTFKSLYQLLTIANISALVSNNYLTIESFVLNAYDTLKTRKDKDKQLYYHIHIIYIIANTLFRNKKFKMSMDYIHIMEQLMLSKRKKHYNQFVLKLHLIKALNLNYLGHQSEAIELTETIINKKHEDLEALLDLKLSLIMFYFQQENLLKVKSILSKLYHTDKWYIEKAGIDWVIKKNLCEIILYAELQEEDIFYSRLKSFKRSYSSYIKDIGQQYILIFLGFIERYYKSPSEVTTKAFKNDVTQNLIWPDAKKEDIFVMSFYAWLKSKMIKAYTYETTLELIKTT